MVSESSAFFPGIKFGLTLSDINQSNRPFNQHATEGQPQTFTKYIKNFY